MKIPIVEIHGTGIHNRGAELMALAIADRLRTHYSGVTIVVPPEFGSIADKARYGFLSTSEAAGKFGWIRTILNSIKWQWRKDVVNPAYSDIVLDASGFAFSDQWGELPAKILIKKMRRFYRKKQLLILLPQALGTFNNPSVRKRCLELFNRSSLVCARDEQSYFYAKKLVPEDKLRKYPDFTIGVSSISSSNLNLPKEFVAIVPNMRMMDKSESADSYLEFLRYAIKKINEQSLTPVFVIHDAQEDEKIIDLLGMEYRNFLALTHKDPRVLKYILGKANFVIGSRFHALVSSLSQGVPCIGAGWSHKYIELFRDFQCTDFLVKDLNDLKTLDTAINLLITKERCNEISQRIGDSALKLMQQVEDMWKEVEIKMDQHLTKASSTFN